MSANTKEVVEMAMAFIFVYFLGRLILKGWK